MTDRYRTRREAAEYLTERGLPTAWRTLQKRACLGDGPVYRLYGNRAVYTERDLDTYVASKLSKPRRSTSEAV